MQNYQPCKRRTAGVVALSGLLLAHGAPASCFNASDNIAVYWGQNSYNQASGSLAQQPLATYCKNTNINIIPMAFMVSITSGLGGQPEINFANQGDDCTGFPGSSLMKCPRIADDIIECQQRYNKTILLSIGGATYTEGGFANVSAAKAAAELVWRTFGPMPSGSITDISANQHPPDLDDGRNRTQLVPPSNSNSTKPSNTTLTTGPTSTSTGLPNDRIPSTATGVNGTSTTLMDQTRTSLGLPSLTTFVISFVQISSETRPTDLRAADLLITDSTTHSTASAGVPPFSSPTKAATTTTSLLAETLSYTDTHPNLQPRQSQTLRPFSNAVVDGFDLDLEAPTKHFRAFALHLRSLMDADTTKQYYITAAPQCPYPDMNMKGMLNNGVPFDAVFVQFYNNYCGLQSFTPGAETQAAFNMEAWDTWAKNTSKNENVKVFLGVPAAQTAAGSGYANLASLQPIIEYCKKFGSFGGVMTWDASQAYSQSGFLSGVKNALLKPATRRRRSIAG